MRNELIEKIENHYFKKYSSYTNYNIYLLDDLLFFMNAEQVEEMLTTIINKCNLQNYFICDFVYLQHYLTIEFIVKLILNKLNKEDLINFYCKAKEEA